MKVGQEKQILEYLAARKAALGISSWRLSASKKTLFAYDVFDHLVVKESVANIVKMS